jgi:hypothetical protein
MTMIFQWMTWDGTLVCFLATLAWHFILLLLNVYHFLRRVQTRDDSLSGKEIERRHHALGVHALFIVALVLFLGSLTILTSKHGGPDLILLTYVKVLWMYIIPVGSHAVLHAWTYAVNMTVLRFVSPLQQQQQQGISKRRLWSTYVGFTLYVLCASIFLPLAIMQDYAPYVLFPSLFLIASVVVVGVLLVREIKPIFNLTRTIVLKDGLQDNGTQLTMNVLSLRLRFFRRGMVLSAISIILIFIMTVAEATHLLANHDASDLHPHAVAYCLFADIIHAFCTFMMSGDSLRHLSHRFAPSTRSAVQDTEFRRSISSSSLFGFRNSPILPKLPVVNKAEPQILRYCNSAVKTETDDTAQDTGARHLLLSEFRKQLQLERDEMLYQPSPTLLASNFPSPSIGSRFYPAIVVIPPYDEDELSISEMPPSTLQMSTQHNPMPRSVPFRVGRESGVSAPCKSNFLEHHESATICPEVSLPCTSKEKEDNVSSSESTEARLLSFFQVSTLHLKKEEVVDEVKRGVKDLLMALQERRTWSILLDAVVSIVACAMENLMLDHLSSDLAVCRTMLSDAVNSGNHCTHKLREPTEEFMKARDDLIMTILGEHDEDSEGSESGYSSPGNEEASGRMKRTGKEVVKVVDYSGDDSALVLEGLTLFSYDTFSSSEESE